MSHYDLWAIVRRSYSFHHTNHRICHFCFAQDRLSIMYHAAGKLIVPDPQGSPRAFRMTFQV